MLDNDFRYDDAPLVVIWEMTRACALACKHCRAEAVPRRNPAELTTSEAFALVDQVAACGDPTFVLTGGDPFMRDDLFKVVEYSTNRGLKTSVSPSATGRATPDSFAALVRSGCQRISLSLDAPDAQGHDAFRGVRDSFERTLRLCREARDAGLTLQINTTIGRFNHTQLAEMAQVVSTLDVAMWSVFFLIPVGRAHAQDVLSAGETERAFETLFALASTLPFPVKTTEAPHYRRFALQHGANHLAKTRFGGVGDGKGFVFISHTGEVWPSGFLPHTAGNVRTASLLELYRGDPFMQALRRPESFSGKCSVCEYNRICGGSRARAFTMLGDARASEPTCTYVPATWKEPVNA